MIPIQHYETTDIFLGAFMLCNGGRLSGISFNDEWLATFSFTGADLHQLEHDYHNGLSLVDPVHLRASLNFLRDILFEMQDRRKRNGPTTREKKAKKRA